MKTSNKLLIAFGVALILVPILAIAVVTSVYYTEGEPEAYRPENAAPFAIKNTDMTSIPLSGHYQKALIEGGNDFQLVVKLIDDKQTGIKIPEALKSLITLKTNANGQLEIKVGKKRDQDQEHANIWIYGPEIDGLVVRDAKGVNLSVKSDSMEISISRCSSFWFDRDAEVKNLVLKATEVKGFGLGEGSFTSAAIDLDNTNFKTEKRSFDKLSVSARGKSDIEIYGGDAGDNSFTVGNLELITKGKSEVKIANINILQCSGRLSDSTRVEMPAKNLNQMFQEKK